MAKFGNVNIPAFQGGSKEFTDWRQEIRVIQSTLVEDEKKTFPLLVIRSLRSDAARWFLQQEKKHTTYTSSTDELLTAMGDHFLNAESTGQTMRNFIGRTCRGPTSPGPSTPRTHHRTP